MKTPPVAATNPSPTFRTRGVIEGFYGRPYSWDERATLVRFIGACDMNTYVYAPKDDPLHRAQWRDLYARADIEGFVRLARIASACGVRFVYAIAPGLSYAASDPSEFARLAGKIGQLLDAGVHGIALLFDDLTADSSALNPVVQADLVAQVRELLPAGPCRDAFWFIGNHYAGRGRDLEAGRVAFPGLYPGHPRDWFDAYAERVPAEVPVGWTGPAVFSARIDAGDAAEFWTVADFLRDPLAYDPESSHAQAVEEVGAAGADALRVFVDHHRSHPVLAPRADAATLHELAGRALGATPEAGARAPPGEAFAFFDGITPADGVDRFSDLFEEISGALRVCA